MTVAEQLRKAAMGPAPDRIDLATAWCQDAMEQVCQYVPEEMFGLHYLGFLRGLTEDECRAFLHLISLVVAD